MRKDNLFAGLCYVWIAFVSTIIDLQVGQCELSSIKVFEHLSQQLACKQGMKRIVFCLIWKQTTHMRRRTSSSSALFCS
jgi:hypothetical protein